jgi:hypothetical protein
MWFNLVWMTGTPIFAFELSLLLWGATMVSAKKWLSVELPFWPAWLGFVPIIYFMYKISTLVNRRFGDDIEAEVMFWIGFIGLLTGLVVAILPLFIKVKP